jgi:hypothetical protein
LLQFRCDKPKLIAGLRYHPPLFILHALSRPIYGQNRHYLTLSSYVIFQHFSKYI